MKELGVQMIAEYSPQARGRSERSFGTWQGRLPQELRLAGIATVEGANGFLREHYMNTSLASMNSSRWLRNNKARRSAGRGVATWKPAKTKSRYPRRTAIPNSILRHIWIPRMILRIRRIQRIVGIPESISCA